MFRQVLPFSIYKIMYITTLNAMYHRETPQACAVLNFAFEVAVVLGTA